MHTTAETGHAGRGAEGRGRNALPAPVRRAGASALLVLALAAPARAGDEYAAAPEPDVWLRAVLDLRTVFPGAAPSWMDRGPGLARFGGVAVDGRFERVARFAIAQGALEPGARLPGGIRFHAQVNWEGNVDTRGGVDPDYDAPRLVEGWLRRGFGDDVRGWAVLAGVSNPTYSLEHIGPAWTPRYTLTPSALDTWLWEEGRVLGAEVEGWHVSEDEWEVRGFGGAGWGPDQQGILLGRRGWVLSDWLAGINSVMPLPGGGTTTQFDERDGRPALYVGLTARDRWRLGELRLGYFDNLGDLSVEGVWRTRYGTAGVALAPLPGLDLLFQYLLGHTEARAGPFDNTVQAFYPLASYRWRQHRLTVRYDNFRVQNGAGTQPGNRQRGWAVAVAYLFELSLRQRLAVEYLTIDSHRPDRAAPDPSDDCWQLSYRFRY